MIKRLFDLIISGFALLIFSPALLMIIVVVKITSPGKVFFTQYRVGLHQQKFRIFKFRTMEENSEMDGRLTVGDDPRITKIGGFLRKFKLDELPQLWNVFIGDMSLVGPRPEVEEFVKLYKDEDSKIIFSVRPGITDLASIELIDESRILSGYEDPRQAYIDIILPLKISMSIKYIRRRSILYDFYILLLTIRKIIVG